MPTPRRRTTSQRRRTSWARSTLQTLTFAAAGYQTIDLLAGFKTAGGTTQGLTIARTHLYFSVTSAVAAAQTLSLGVLRGQNTDVGANIAGAPSPSVDPYEDWAMWAMYAADAGGPGLFPHNPINVLEWDIKAMRKLPELQMSWNLVVQTQTATALTVDVAASTLVMLP